MSHCGCEKERTQQSTHSPTGLVLDDEDIVYALVDPDTSSVKAISKSRLKAGDLSVCRAWHCTGQEAYVSIVQSLLTKNPDRTDNGFLYATAGAIRQIRLGTSSERAFCVIDDGLPDFVAHAVLSFAEPNDPMLRNHRETARANLLALLNKNGIQAAWRGAPFRSEPEAADV